MVLFGDRRHARGALQAGFITRICAPESPAERSRGTAPSASSPSTTPARRHVQGVLPAGGGKLARAELPHGRHVKRSGRFPALRLHTGRSERSGGAAPPGRLLRIRSRPKKVGDRHERECRCTARTGCRCRDFIGGSGVGSSVSGMFFDGFDIYVASTVLGATLKSGFSTLGENALLRVAHVSRHDDRLARHGFLGDRVRPPLHVSGRISRRVRTRARSAQRVAPNMAVLIACRFVMGLGLGAENVVGYSTLAEFAPPALERGKLQD